MPRRVRQKGRPNHSKRSTDKKFRFISYRLLLRDIQAKTALENMTSSATNERRHRNCLF